MKNNTILLFLLLMFFFALSSCDSVDKLYYLRDKLAKIKQNSVNKNKKNAKAAIKLPSPVIYGIGTLNQEGTANQTHDPLQSYPLTQFKFVGTLSQNNELLAYVSTPDGKILSVKRGDMIGNQYGRIINIDSSKIEVSQKELTKGNKLTEKIIVIQP